MAQLTPLTRLQHLRLTQCVLLGNLCMLSLLLCAIAQCSPTVCHAVSRVCSDCGCVKFVRYCECDGRSYPAGASGLSEVLLFGGLRSLRLQFDDLPELLFLAKGFSELTALTNVELRLDHERYDYAHGRIDHFHPTFCTLPYANHLRLLNLLLVSAASTGAGYWALLQVVSVALCPGGEVGHLPALEVLRVDCYKVEPPLSSTCQMQLENAGFRAPPHTVY